MKRWTLGFIFNSDHTQVLLIHKNRPPHQAGRWNGLGGKYEQKENAEQCISREVKEESNLYIAESEWKHIGHMYGARHTEEGQNEDWEMDVLVAIYSGSASDAQTVTDEEVQWFPVNKLPDTIRNLPWLIPLCIYAVVKNHVEFFDMKYTNSKEWR